jgi:hypothetical protein
MVQITFSACSRPVVTHSLWRWRRGAPFQGSLLAHVVLIRPCGAAVFDVEVTHAIFLHSTELVIREYAVVVAAAMNRRFV